ncbi:MAG: ABC transporter permease [Microbacteriaceae bacterium]|nr:MAG: ABC transporter permease [Microbacteriaceae bacterium]
MTQLNSTANTVGTVKTPSRPPVANQSRWSRTGPILSIGVIVLLLVLWWVLTTGTGIIRRLYFPTPEAVLTAFSTLGWQLLVDAGVTLLRVLVSLIGGSTLGVLVGLAMARSRLFWYMANPVIEAVRPVPPVALIPFVILWFGIGDSGKFFLGALACFMVMVINTTVAIGNVPPVYLRAARSLGASSGTVYRKVVLPAIVPEILSGFRIGNALAFATIVAAEFLGADAGIGMLIMQASRTLNTSVVLLGTAVIAAMAVLLDLVISRIIRYLTRWATNH